MLDAFRAACAALFLYFPMMASSDIDPSLVRIENGWLQGSLEDEVLSWLGIPYAKAPAGALRWRPPQPAENWSDTRDATSFGHACPQPLGEYPAWADEAILRAGMDEDCLNLNVYSPLDRAGHLLPVMVYIHGGNQIAGANSMPVYDGSFLASQGIVVVVINYRLGYLGRFAHPSLTRLQTGEYLANYGNMDQILALKWVQRNIRQFGGDPGQVTVFGHSAGGVSVNYLLGMPEAEGLFHRAIAQGSGLLIDRDTHLRESLPRGISGLSGEQVGERLAQHFDIERATDIERVAALRSLSPQQLVDYQKTARIPLYPYVDGALIPDDLAKIFERGEQHKVPYIGGVNSWEASPIAGIPLIGKWFLGGALIAGQTAEDLSVFDDQWTRIGLGQRWYQDGMFLMSTRYLAANMSKLGGPAWLYRINYVPSAVRGRIPGAPHGMEIPYLFGAADKHPEYLRPYDAGLTEPSDEDRAWAETVRGYWLNFARTGDPNGPGLPEWPQYDSVSDLTLVLGSRAEPAKYLDKELLDKLQQRALLRRQRYEQ